MYENLTKIQAVVLEELRIKKRWPHPTGRSMIKSIFYTRKSRESFMQAKNKTKSPQRHSEIYKL